MHFSQTLLKAERFLEKLLSGLMSHTVHFGKNGTEYHKQPKLLQQALSMPRPWPSSPFQGSLARASAGTCLPLLQACWGHWCPLCPHEWQARSSGELTAPLSLEPPSVGE